MLGSSSFSWINSNQQIHVAVIDGCSHLTNTLTEYKIPIDLNISLEQANQNLNEMTSFQVILLGVSLYPIRRKIVADLRKINTEASLIFLRKPPFISNTAIVNDKINADFILSSYSPSYIWEASQSFLEIFPLLACNHMNQPPEASIVEKAVRIISTNFNDPRLSLNKVAQKLGVSGANLSRVLNHFVGIRFRQLLQQTRLEAAKQMLVSSNNSVKQVAYDVGFSDSDYFSRAFKHYTGDCATTFKDHPVH